MKIAMRIARVAVFITLTFFIGRPVANIFLDWPAPMPQWLHATTMFMLRITGLGEDNNTDDAEVMATLIIVCMSMAATALALWLLAHVLRRLIMRPKT
jgi:hypothetical protein